MFLQFRVSFDTVHTLHTEDRRIQNTFYLLGQQALIGLEYILTFESVRLQKLKNKREFVKCEWFLYFQQPISIHLHVLYLLYVYYLYSINRKVFSCGFVTVKFKHLSIYLLYSKYHYYLSNHLYIFLNLQIFVIYRI